MFLPDRQSLEFSPDYRSTQVAWQGLIPFGAWAIRSIRPRRVVELGSYRGDSYFTMLQAAADLPQVEEIWGVDSWAGDIHTGPYGEDVFHQFLTEHSRRNDPRARYLRMTFDEALAQFKDGSVDLLHIDGAHDYASVRQDYLSWLPKMTPDGIILFHDTEVRSDDFGVYQLWAEIAAEAPGRSRNLPFSNGLGILCLGSARDNAIQDFCALPHGDSAVAEIALKLAGDRIIALSRYEYNLIQRTNTPIPEGHVFARGEALESIRSLWQIETNMRDVAAPAMTAAEIEAIGRAQVERLVAQSEENLAYSTRRIRSDIVQSLTEHFDNALAEAQEAQRKAMGLAIAEALQPVIDRIAAAEAQEGDRAARVLADARDSIQHAIQDLLAQRGAEIYAAIASLAQQDTDRKLKAGLKAYDKRVSQIVANDLPKHQAIVDPMVRRAGKMKNDAQDDAIIGIGAKVDAQEQAIQSFAKHLGNLLKHPLFAS